MPHRATTGARHEIGGYREFAPPPALAAAAEGVWIHRSAVAGMHLVLPDPALNLAFRCRRLADGRVAEPHLTVIGPKTRPFPFLFRPGDEIAAVKVKLEWAKCCSILCRPSTSTARTSFSPGDVRLPPWLSRPPRRNRLGRHAAALLASTLATALAGTRHAPVAPAHALELVRQATGRVSVEAVADQMRVSLRHLHRGVLRESAISLKVYAQMLRLNHAMATADRIARPGWARVAAESGFCDQSHLVRECRALAGLTPARIHLGRRAEAETSNRG